MSITGKALRVSRDDKTWDDVILLDQMHFPRSWKVADWDGLNFSLHKLWCWSAGGKVLGFALFGTADETAHLLKISVHPDVRGSGVAPSFWKALTEELRSLGHRSIYLEVEESNARAQGFYRRVGFQEIRRVKSYYSDGENAVMMQLTL